MQTKCATMQEAKASWGERVSAICADRRYAILLLLGFASGLPVALTTTTLQAWFTAAGFNLKTIGAVTLLGLPAGLRLLWAPLLDRFSVPGFDRRRGWLFVTQLGLILSIVFMAYLLPQQIFHLFHWAIPTLFLAGFIVSFLSASQDIVITAWQTEILPAHARGLGASIYVVGWRVGSILSGALGLVFAQALGWKTTYFIMAALMGMGLLATLLAPVPTIVRTHTPSLMQSVFMPLREFFRQYGVKTLGLLFLLLVTYKVGDALTLALNTTFLLRKMGFDLATIGLVNKTVSVAAALLGGVVAGVWMTRLTLYRALMVFGVMQALPVLGYALMALVGKHVWLLIIVAFSENFCGGMGNIALLALILALCHVECAATQFALLSTLVFLPRVAYGPIAASLVAQQGWAWFFVICFLVSLPTLGLVWVCRNEITRLDR